MASNEFVSSQPSFLDLRPSSSQHAIGLAAICALAAGFALTVYLSTTPMPQIAAFIPMVAAMIFLNDFITSVMLFGQFSLSRSKATLMLGGGYLFTALIIIPYSLTFPGAFSTSGLLGASIQSTAWLYIFWHFGFPASVVAYATCRNRSKGSVWRGSPSTAIAGVIISVVVVVCVLGWLAEARGICRLCLLTSRIPDHCRLTSSLWTDL